MELLDTSKRLLIIGAHPDDIEFSCGALIRKRKCHNIWCVVLTDGAMGKEDIEKREGENFIMKRVAESSSAFRILGVDISNLIFLLFPDQLLHLNIKSVSSKLEKLNQKICPDIVLTHAYEGAHPDHDISNFIASQIFDKVYEFAGYNNFNGRHYKEFIPGKNHILTIKHSDLNAVDVDLIQKSMLEFKSQMYMFTDFLKSNTKSCFRKIEAYNYAALPHPGQLYYQTWGCPVDPDQVIWNMINFRRKKNEM